MHDVRYAPRQWLTIICSLAALGLTCLAAHRSYEGGDLLERVSGSHRIVVNSNRGQLGILLWSGAFTRTVQPGDGGAPDRAWEQWAHWEPSYLPYGTDGWSGMEVGSAPVRPVKGFSLHDWLSPKWSGRHSWIYVWYGWPAVVFSIAPAWIICRSARALWPTQHKWQYRGPRGFDVSTPSDDQKGCLNRLPREVEHFQDVRPKAQELVRVALPRTRERHVDDPLDPPRPRRHDDDAVAHVDRFVDVVGD